LNYMLAEASGQPRGERTIPEQQAELLATLDQATGRMTHVLDSATELARDAKAADFADIAQQADALRQQLTAARNKLKLLHREPAEA
jgi:hypothetical protein